MQEIIDIARQLTMPDQTNVVELQNILMNTDPAQLLSCFLEIDNQNVALILFYAMKNSSLFGEYFNSYTYEQLFTLFENLYNQLDKFALAQNPYINLLELSFNFHKIHFQNNLESFLNFINNTETNYNKITVFLILVIQNIDYNKIQKEIIEYFKQFLVNIIEMLHLAPNTVESELQCSYIKSFVQFWTKLIDFNELLPLFDVFGIDSQHLSSYSSLISQIIVSKYSFLLDFLEKIFNFYLLVFSINPNVFFQSIMTIAEYEYSIKQKNDNLHENYFTKNAKPFYSIATTLYTSLEPNEMTIDESYYLYLLNLDNDKIFERSCPYFLEIINRSEIQSIMHLIILLPRTQKIFDFIMPNRELILNALLSQEFTIENTCEIFTNFPEIIQNIIEIDSIIDNLDMLLITNCFESLPQNFALYNNDTIHHIYEHLFNILSKPIDISVESVDLILSSLISITPEYLSSDLEISMQIILSNKNLFYSVSSLVDKLGEQSDYLYIQLFDYVFHKCDESSDILIALSHIVKKCTNIMPEIVQDIINAIHKYMEIDLIKSADLISNFSLRFREAVKQLGEEVFLHLCQVNSEDGYELKSIADMIVSIDAFDVVEKQFIEKISNSLTNLQRSSSATFAVNVGYILMVAGGTYFARETPYEDEYIDLLISYLQKSQLVNDDFDELCALYTQAAKTVIVFAKHLKPASSRRLLKRNIIQILKNGETFERTNDICFTALQKLKGA